MLISSINFYSPGNSPWPFIIGIGSLRIIRSVVWWLHNNNIYPLLFSLLILSLLSRIWWVDLKRESLFIGSHCFEVQDCLKFGIVLFIFSECIFFIGFFWAFFHFSLSPTPLIGLSWPPIGIFPVDPFGIPLFNTCLLLSSGVTLTVAHHYLVLQEEYSRTFLAYTILIGYVFLRCQYSEWWVAKFTICDSVYGSCFYIATGFHGIHVFVGAVFLVVCWFRLGTNINTWYHSNQQREYSRTHHVSFEIAIWYWHFVDVVWLLLFYIVYIWGS